MPSFSPNNVRSRIDVVLSSLHRRILPNSVRPYAFALLCVVIATGLEFALLRLDDGISPLGSYYPTVLFAALVGGIGPGVLAAMLGGLIGWRAITAPQFSFAIFQYGNNITLVTYALASMLMVWGADYFRRLSKRLEDEERFRKLTVQELAHRLKNKIATIRAVISIQLREHPQIRDDLLGRLMALTTTDALIDEAQGQGAHILDIARAELGPYVASRSTIQGVNVPLPPKYALTIALLVHELATKSAKYGALSAGEGRVSVRSSVSGAVSSKLDRFADRFTSSARRPPTSTDPGRLAPKAYGVTYLLLFWEKRRLVARKNGNPRSEDRRRPVAGGAVEYGRRRSRAN